MYGKICQNCSFDNRRLSYMARLAAKKKFPTTAFLPQPPPTRFALTPPCPPIPYRCPPHRGPEASRGSAAVAGRVGETESYDTPPPRPTPREPQRPLPDLHYPVV